MPVVRAENEHKLAFRGVDARNIADEHLIECRRDNADFIGCKTFLQNGGKTLDADWLIPEDDDDLVEQSDDRVVDLLVLEGITEHCGILLQPRAVLAQTFGNIQRG